MAHFLKTIIFFTLFALLNAQLYNGWNFGRYYATAPASMALVHPPAVAVPYMRPVVAAPAVSVVGAPAVPVAVPGYAPFAASAVLLGSNKGVKKN
ncbi:Hypothetical protein SRAE_1000121300 [Strongyloides ratti]|uniref:Uncharacterized protein n=1 Tax=Strongyloides ratti TaxID=34506 RepID=A0A090KZT5_STRRB|nr:Hypothetical protein SRAE_1000121300 [Strongyloides ratti]CEF62946.1 Hypothetical protein SRAE_1000121300 [Strongyloides ratti]